MSKNTVDEIEKVKSEWRETYKKANDKEPPEITYEKGWFRINNSKTRYRKKDIIQFTENLLARLQQ